MKCLLLSVAAFLLLVGCDQGTEESSVQPKNGHAAPVRQEVPVKSKVSGWNPGEACSFLEPSLKTGAYKLDYADEYYCFTPYKDVGGGSSGLANNLAYYVDGVQDVAEKLKLVLNYNQPKSAESATEQLISSSSMLAERATDQRIPEEVARALSVGSPLVKSENGYRHEVKRDDWPTGRGYEVHYVLSKE